MAPIWRCSECKAWFWGWHGVERPTEQPCEHCGGLLELMTRDGGGYIPRRVRVRECLKVAAA